MKGAFFFVALTALLTGAMAVFSSTENAPAVYRVSRNGSPAGSYVLHAGDSLLFERGGKWKVNKQVSVYCDGANAPDIYIGAYGTGDKPVLTTRTSLPNWKDPAKWLKVRGDSVWKIYMPLQYSYRIYLNGVEGTRAYLNYQGAPVNRIVDSLNRFQNYACDETVEYAVYVYAPGRNPATFYSTMEYVGAPSTTVEISGSGWTIEGLDVQGGATTSVFAVLVSKFAIRNNKIGIDASHSGLSFSGARDGLIESNEIESGDRKKDRHLFQHGVGDGLYMSAGIHNVDVRWNYIHDWGHSCFELDTKGNAIHPGYYRNSLLLSNLNVYENLLKAANVDYCRGAEFNVDTTVANRRMAKGTVRFYRNVIDSTHVQSQFGCEGMIVAHNVFMNTFNPTNLEYADHDNGWAIAFAGYNMTTPKRMIVANNVFAFNESGGLKFGSNEAATYDTVTGNVIVNNIFYKNGWKGNREVSMGHVNGVQLMVENYGASATKLGPHIIRNNLFLSDVPQHAYFDNRYSFPYYAKPAAHLNTNLSRERSWLVSGNLETDPLFTDAEGGDFSLQKGSPALRAGLDLSYYGLPEKFTNGSVWPSSIAKGQRLLWSIGANVENIIQPVAKQFSIRRKVRTSG